jgi:hypothetical protein
VDCRYVQLGIRRAKTAEEDHEKKKKRQVSRFTERAWFFPR